MRGSLITVTAVLAASVGLVACQPGRESSAPALDTPPTPEVAVEEPARRPVPVPAVAVRDEPVVTMEDDAGEFAANAFPPIIPDTEWHANAWVKNDCLRCHETGVAGAPVFVHEGLPEITRVAMCRSCHVLVPGHKPRMAPAPEDGPFLANAFPPMIPNSLSHRRAWTRDDCLLCHTSGIRGAPLIRHEGLPSITLDAKCRTCHVQVRSHETTLWGR